MRASWLTSSLAAGLALAAPAAVPPALAAPPAAPPASAAPEPVPPAPVAPPRTTTAWTLDDVVREALARSPAIAVKEAAIRVAEPRVRLAGTWPEPMFKSGFKNMGILPTLGTDPGTELSLGIAQTVPFPGKTRLRSEAASAAVEVAAADLEDTRRDVVRRVKEAWFDLYQAQRELLIVKETRFLFGRAAEAAAARYAVGKVGQMDVLKAEVEGDRMRDEAAMLEGRQQALQGTLAGLIGHPPLGTTFGSVATPDLVVPALTAEYVTARILGEAPALIRAGAEIGQREKAADLARLDVLPDLTLMGDLMNRGALPGGWEISAGLDLPIFYRDKQARMIAESDAMVAQMRRDREKMITDMLAMAREELAMAKSAATRERLLRTSILPRARLALQAGLAGYSVGMENFLTLFEAIMTIQGFQREHAAVLVEGNKALARLEALLGGER